MILVTGGAGFIGSNLVAALTERGKEVVVCDWLGTADKWRNLANQELAAFVHPENLLKYLDDNHDIIEAVFHMGAISATTEPDADLVVSTNFGLTMWLFDWCTANEVPFHYASSAATYGDGSAGFEDDDSVEGLARLRPLNVYGWSKHLVDRRIARVMNEYGPSPPQWVGYKFFNVYGPNEGHKRDMMSVVAKLVPEIERTAKAKLFKSHNPDYPDGGQMRDFVHVRDCVDVMLWFYEHDNMCGIFNVGTGEARSFVDLATATFNALGREPEIEFIETPEAIRAKYQYFTQASMSRLRLVGYDSPFTSLEEGVTGYVQRHLMTR